MRPQNYPSVHGGHGKPSAVHHARHVAVLSAVQSHPQPTHVFIHLVMVQHQNGGKQIHHGCLALYIYMLQDDIHIHTCYESKTYWLINTINILINMTHDLQMRIQFDVVEIILLGLYFNGILLAHISLFMDLLLPVGRVVIEIHLRVATSGSTGLTANQT